MLGNVVGKLVVGIFKNLFCCFEIANLNCTTIVHDTLIEGFTHGCNLVCFSESCCK